MSLCFQTYAQSTIRRDISLNDEWQTTATTDNKRLPIILPSEATQWKKVNVPHNWDSYEGYRRLLHGNRHGEAWYKKTFVIRETKSKKRFFLFFEGVGSYATVYFNDKYVGEHAGGRTSFTIDITHLIKTDGSANQLDVKASHPSNIQDLPWVCGGCSDERGFSEGSQPMGIFRPVHLIVTHDVRIEPFGIHAWADIKNDRANLFINATLKNYSNQQRNISLTHQLIDAGGRLVTETSQQHSLKAGDSLVLSKKDIAVDQPVRWSVERPYLYKIVSTIHENNVVVDKTETDFGFRTINWNTPTRQFVLNDKPVFINGVAEYEHLLGQSHAFGKEQVEARMKWLRFAGFNSFRDGHQPHNLLYGKLCNQYGVLWWTQLSAHIWYDTPEFRSNFKKLLREWVIERRNDPSVVLWGLQNESKLPEEFAKECTELIRSLDPTTSSQRLVTTCNGGSGTDWDVPQNWTGTYGGNPALYANDIKKQVLIGEYGAWRTLDLHTEGGFVQNGILSEDRMTLLMEQKVRLAESVKDSCAGQFFWLLTSHDNPGRVQGGEGLRELDRIGPVNYKGLLTPWEEPADVFYMFRSNYAPKEKEPMVYIASHTWPNRWTRPGIKDSIFVYSNCDEVELFNDIKASSLGKRKRNGIGTHFQWDNVNIQYNVLFAIGYVNGKAVASDTIVLNHLPQSPHFGNLYTGDNKITQPKPGYNYIYRVNCGGPDYTDQFGNLWSADKSILKMWKNPVPNTMSRRPDMIHQPYYGSSSWTNEFSGVPPFFASQRRTFSPIGGTRDWSLFQTFRYGKDQLEYGFPLPDGEYLVELFFVEPWLGIGGGMDAGAMRLFDVAINEKTVLKNVDIWAEAGTNAALKKAVKVNITGGVMVISFPQSRAGQALISAIAISSVKRNIKPAPSASFISPLSDSLCKCQAASWLDIGTRLYKDTSIAIKNLPPALFGADWLQYSKYGTTPSTSFVVRTEVDVFIAYRDPAPAPGSIPKGFEYTMTNIETDEGGLTTYPVYRRRFSSGEKVDLPGGINYIVAVLRANRMQPAYDLKPVTQYKSNVVKYTDGVIVENVNGRECASVKSNNKVTIEYPVKTGVADIYSITMKYYYPGEKALKGRLRLIAAGGAMMMDEEVSFTLTRSGKWNQFTVNTGSMINAGNYTVRLLIEGAEGLAISGIDIQ